MPRKSLGMQLPREILDGGNDSRGSPIDSIANDGKMAVADSIETSPSGTLGKHVKIILCAVGM
jgi:hypothetical protein